MNDLDILLLRHLKYRTEFFKLKDVAKQANISDSTNQFVADFEKYFLLYPSHTVVDAGTFMMHFVQEWHKGLTKEVYVSWGQMTLTITSADNDADQSHNIVRWISEMGFMTSVANLAQKYKDGDIEDPYQAVEDLRDVYRRRRGLRGSTYIDTPIGELLLDEFSDAGLRFRLGVLQRHMRPLRGGDFGIIAGRPDKGKTTFLTSETTFLVPQLPDDRNLIWLNNEGPGSRIIPRLYQSALGITMSQMRELHEAGKLVSSFEEVVGRLDRIRVYDIHGYTNGQVTAILEENNPGIVVFDMIDNIRGFGDAARTDLALEHMYQWGREQMVKYDAIGLATSQISNEGDGLLFPTLGMLKDSKTGKQGACDFQIMIGASNDPGMEGIRGISIPKNKLRRPDVTGNPNEQVVMDGVNARYSDVPM